MEFNFLTEAPSKEDRFNCRSHQLVADSIVSVFENKPDIHIVGLEGSLGSGKSTVIELIKESPNCSSYKFFVFDVEQHHHNSTKKDFITLFSSWLLEFCVSNKKENITTAKDMALGNILEYEKKNKSNISWWTISFIISLLFSASSMRPLFNHLDLFFTENNYEFFCMELGIWGTFFLLPVILLLLLFLASKLTKKTNINFNIPTVGDLFKRNTTDYISEKLEVTREVGSIELRESMKVFVNSIPANIKCILIIDNLDRVSPDKVKEVWSDLEIFISVANSSLKMILPFSSRHIAQALSSEDGYEFIAKRIPVSFRVPPIVSVGWQETFEKFWRDATSNADERTIHTCAYILELLLPKNFNGHVTPRLMKRYINDIYSLIVTTPVDIHPSVSAFYVASVIYNNDTHSVESILEIPPKYDIIRSIHKKLNLIVSHDIEWPIQVMCLHYQTLPNIAISELLNQPLDRALKQHDAEAFIERGGLYGFKDACEKVISNNSHIDIIKLAYALFKKDMEFTCTWFSQHADVVNHEIKVQLSETSNQYHDDEFVEALLEMVKNKMPIDVEPINILYRQNLHEVTYSINDSKNKFKGLDSLHSYSQLINKVPKKISNPDGAYYVQTLWEGRRSWPFWSIEDISLPHTQVKDAIASLFYNTNTPPGMGITHNILNRIKLGWFDFREGIGDKSPISTPEFSEFTQNADIFNISALVFDHRWHTQVLTQYYINQINRIDNSDINEELVAQALANIIQTRTYTTLPQWEAVAITYPGYTNYLPMYLPVVSDFSSIMNAIERDEISDIIKDAVNSLISNNKIYKLNIRDILTKHYSTIKSAVTDTQRLLSWMKGWIKNLKPEHIALEDFDNSFIVDVLSNSVDFEDYRKILYSKIDTEQIEIPAWIDIISSKHKNTTSIIDGMKNSSYHLSHESKLDEAIEELFTTNKHIEIIETIDDAIFFDALISIIDSGKYSSLLKKLSKCFLIQSVPDIIKERLIINLGNRVSLPISKEKVDQEIIKDLICSITIDERIAKWLDTQSYRFNIWDQDDLLDVAKCINKHMDIFEKILRDKHLTSAINSIAEVDADPDKQNLG